MKIYAINGGPRKNGNTVALLEKALEGARSTGADVETEMIHLYDYNYKGCISCYSCKRKDSPTLNRCAVKDELAPMLEKVTYADGVIFGTPVFFSGVTGALQSFYERFWFPLSSFNVFRESFAPKKVNMGAIYTMHVSKEEYPELWANNYVPMFATKDSFFESLFGGCEKLFSCNTTHFDDYSKYESRRFDPEVKAKAKKEQFPIDLQNAFDMGVKIATK